MVLIKTHVLLLIALIAANLIFAKESSGEVDYEQENSQPDAEQNEQNEDEPGQNRFFFTRFVGCNYTAQAGRTCTNCRQSLLCLPSNVGMLRTCVGLLRYCNNGICSFIGGSACTSSG